MSASQSTSASRRGGPIERYREDLSSGHIVPDPGQEAVVSALQDLHDELTRATSAPLSHRIRAVIGPARPYRRRIKGLYLFGGVGRGKTYLMDCFFQTLPLKAKRREHFHRFMNEIHNHLKAHKGRRNPLEDIAEELATDIRVLCFDEFFVNDITDAMLLGSLLRGLFRRRVTLVATSNTHPDDLYRGGLQRERFLPAIDQIKRHTTVMRIADGEDFRLRVLDKAEIYHHPLDDAADRGLARSFSRLASSPSIAPKSVSINGRTIEARAEADGIAWFDFPALCEGPRSQKDYLELAQCYHTILLSNVPLFKDDKNDAARRFINLVDVLYDRKVNLIVSAADSPERLYRGRRLAADFQRTASRLREMATHAYLGNEHRP